MLAQNAFYDGHYLVEIFRRDGVLCADDIGRMPVEVAGLVDFDVALRNAEHGEEGVQFTEGRSSLRHHFLVVLSRAILLQHIIDLV